MPMQVTTKVTEQQRIGASGKPVTTLHFSGDISSASKGLVFDHFQSIDKSANEQILLDFKNVEYLNSSGIALLIQLLVDAKKAGQTIAVAGLSAHFTRVFAMVGITKYAKLYLDEAAALAAF